MLKKLKSQLHQKHCKQGDNRRKAGEDLQQGLPALLKGAHLTPAALGLIGKFRIAHSQGLPKSSRRLLFYWR